MFVELNKQTVRPAIRNDFQGMLQPLVGFMSFALLDYAFEEIIFVRVHSDETTQVEELIERLKPFSRESVLWFCAIASLALKLWEGGAWDQARSNAVRGGRKERQNWSAPQK